MKRILFFCAFAAMTIAASAQEQAPSAAPSAEKPIASSDATITATMNPANPRAGKVTFQGYFDGGVLVNGEWAGPTLDLSLGARIYDYAYLAVETGVNYLFNTKLKDEEGKALHGGYIPVGFLMRGYYPLTPKIYGFAGFNLGCAIVDNSKVWFHCQFLAGFDFGRFNLGMGWDRYGSYMDTFVCKLGVRFGK